MKYKLTFLSILLCSFLMISCNNNRFDIDVSDVELDMKIYRFDSIFFNIDSNDIYKDLDKLKQNHSEFLNFYNNAILQLGNPEEAQYPQKLNDFFEYCNDYGIYDKVEEVFYDDDLLTAAIINAFKHYKYYFPNHEIPQIYTCISGFQESIFPTTGIVAISLDKYLGADCEFYTNLAIDHYKRIRMHAEMIPVDCMRTKALNDFQFNDSVSTLLNYMIYEGRIQYFIDAMLPDAVDTLKWGYTMQQYDWIKRWEEKVWDYFIEKKILFTRDKLEIRTYTADAPFTTPFHNNSAPRVGTWIGYKIVKAFMDNNQNVSLSQLMKITDYQEIFNRSKYKP